MTAATATSTTLQAAGTPDAAHDSSTILVKFADPAAAPAIIAAHGDRHVAQTATNVDVVKIAAGASVEAKVAVYGARSDVIYAEPNYIARTSALSPPNDPSYASDWGMSKIDVVNGWTSYPGSYTSSGGVPLAIIDTGVQSGHPDLSGRVQTGSGANCVPFPGTCAAGGTEDDNGHGTHVAGIAGAATNNGVGVAGVAFSSPIIPVKVLDSGGSGSYAGITNGILWAVQHGAKALNLSLGGTGFSQTLCDAITTALNSYGAVVVAAAGNSGDSVPSYPAACPGTVGVAATDSGDGSPSWSNFGSPNVFVSAPGAGIYSTYFGSAYASLSGTSMASPFVTGLVALLLGQVSGRTPADVKRLLATTSDKVGGVAYGADPYGTCSGCTWNQDYGYGRINAARALAVAAPPPPGTLTFAVAAGVNDGDVSVNNMGAGTAYPPTGTAVPSSSRSSFGVRRAGPVSGGYEVRVGLLRFDTSSIPAGATITSASLRLYVLSRSSGNARNLVAEWANGSAWPLDGSDYSASASNSASTGVPIGSLSVNAVNTLSLQNLGSISRTGYTTLRLHVDGGQPSGENGAFFAAFENGSATAAQLVVNYTLAPPPPSNTFTVAAGADDGDVSVNNMGAGTAYPPTGTAVPSSSRSSFGVRRAGPVSGGYEVRTALLRFDTSSIPAGATITSASLRVYVLSRSSVNGRNLVAEWNNGAVWPLAAGGYTATASNSASTGVPIGSLSVNAVNTLSLQNLGSISRTGYTTLRLHVDGGQPSGENGAFFAAFENGSATAAQLVVNWTP